MDAPPENDLCSICRDNFNLPCQANCSHWFCGNCILCVWDHGAALRPCRCPICRRIITLLIPCGASLQHHHDQDVSEVLQSIQRYNRSFGGGPGGTNGLIQKLQDLPFFLRRFSRELVDPQRDLPFILILRILLEMVVTVIYVVSPIDIIPEGIVGFIGILDDLALVLLFFLHVSALYRAVLLSRHGGGPPAVPSCSALFASEVMELEEDYLSDDGGHSWDCDCSLCARSEDE